MVARKRSQLALELIENFGWGGERKRAGRPRTKRSRVAHRTRPALKTYHPVHSTIRCVPGAPNLRAHYAIVKQALEECREHLGMRIVLHSVQHNHVHLIVET